jgi:HemY protein
MIRVVIYVLVIFAFAAGFAWLADNPGSLTLSFREYDVRTTVMAAAIFLILLLVIGRVLWLVLRGVLRAPRRLRQQAAERRREAAYRALTDGFVAVGSGDPSHAAYYAAEARYYAQGEELTLLLAAQTAQLTGDEMGARAAYEAMLARPKMRVLGFRGLFLEARRRGDNEAARSFAAAADSEKPGLNWAGSALLEYQAADGEWAEALTTLTSLTAAGAIVGDRANRLNAVLRVARAMELEDRDPTAARDLALEAHRLAPELVPAAVLAARLATRLGDPKRAMKVIETTWRIEPHPELAGAYMDVRSGESGRDRMKRIAHLAKIRTNHIEGRLAMARAAIDAQDWVAAREELRGLLATNPTGRAYVMMAEIEEGEHGDIGRARDWLSRAVRAPRDPTWTADGYVFDHWEPVSPISGRIDAFEWKVPADRLPALDPAQEKLPAMRDISPDSAAEEAAPEPKAAVEAAPAASPAAVPAATPAAAAPDVAEPAKPVEITEPVKRPEPKPTESGTRNLALITTVISPNHQPDDPGPDGEAPSHASDAEPEPPRSKRFKLFPS